MSAEQDNLKKLSRTSIPMNFVKKTKGAWEHADWEEFSDNLKSKGYSPINLDEVGLLLEKKKAVYLSKKKKK